MPPRRRPFMDGAAGSVTNRARLHSIRGFSSIIVRPALYERVERR